MFGFLLSQQRRARRQASHWLDAAERLHHFRRDLLTPAQNQRLLAAQTDLRNSLRDRKDAAALKLGIEHLELVMREVGGRLYPATSLTENIEFFLVAAIVILGLRAYFVQPFKIPTNSMWPTYHGMTHELHAEGEKPGLVTRAGRFLAFGAVGYSAVAQADGEVLMPVTPDLNFIYQTKSSRTLLVFPGTVREYTFLVGGETTTLQVPGDFDLERVLEERLGVGVRGLRASINDRLSKNGMRPESSVMTFRRNGQEFNQRVYWVPIGLTARRGESFLDFDIETGDLLFVDRFTYQFFPPKVGQAFVFRTGNIPALKSSEGEKYFVKRLVGAPGDQMEIRQPALWRNGAPASGAAAFNANATREDRYPGYVNGGLLEAGETATVPAHHYMALGDNSPLSHDSRYWGFVPDHDVVGKPLFIYYPLTRRWGLAK